MVLRKLIFFCCVQWTVIIGSALKITSLDVPALGYHQVNMNCRYVLEHESEKLYDVKWYKDAEQFFRCTLNGPTQEFPLDGVKLYSSGTSNLGSCQFELTGLTNKSSGVYTCEVSLDWPTFAMTRKSAKFTFVNVPPPPKATVSVNKENTIQPELLSAENGENGTTSSPGLLTLLLFILLMFLYLTK